MHKPLSNFPVLDTPGFTARLAEWQPILAKAQSGMNRVVIEWDVIQGPRCFVYPAGQRALGVDLCADGVTRKSDERWADFLEYQFVPSVADAVTHHGLNPQVICVDLRPVQIQRQRRRALEATAHAKTGLAH
jgi:hypothetical protein